MSSCKRYCNSSQTSPFSENFCTGSSSKTAEIVIKYLNVNETLTFTSVGRTALQISCEFPGNDFCSESGNANKSSSECLTTQRTVISTEAKSTKDFTSPKTTKPDEISRKTVQDTTLTSLPLITDSLLTPSFTFMSRETTSSDVTITINNVSDVKDQARSQVCSQNTGIIVGAVMIGFIVGTSTTAVIFFFLKRRTEQISKNHTVSHPIYDLNERQTSIRATPGETYNDIQIEPQSPKISCVLPITKEEIKSSTATNDPEIYHHLREDYAVKDRSNYYDHAMPLNGPQEIESEQYGKLKIEENGAYSTFTNTNYTGPDSVRNEAYSTIETNEFQLMEIEGNNADNSASYFVLAKE
ncbi:uncharacterized protein LOC128160459 isoform X2 [Crassostrea angulata]|uniref:uncharacterized protein LOC128160459 isoform X2 n=1 Tax=Magallana angulata TaxID=2784310 RepID=UPI0022B1D0DD|nr:uncharacterized protein LOC128160459 isoform X2 [Crassostrea angulata]